MRRLKITVSIAAVVVFLICLYTFLLENKVFEWRFENEGIPWYFLAKGIFCSLALYLLVRILETVSDKNKARE